VSAGLKAVALDEVAELNPRLAEKLAPDQEVSFVPMSAVSAEAAGITEEETRTYAEVSKGYTPFVTGDVLVAKITPCFENGKIVQAQLTRRLGFGSTEFHVIRTTPAKLDARYALHFLRLGQVRLAGERRMTGSAGQRRVPENFLAKLKIPLPPLAEQRRIAEVLDRTEVLRAKRRAALAQLDTFTQSLFLDLFGDPKANPRRWPKQKLGELLEIEWGNTSITKESYVPKGIPAYSAAGQDGFLPHGEHEGEGIVLSAIGARCGKCFYVSGGPWTAIKNTITISPKPISMVEARYVFPMINDERFWPNRGAGQPFITLGIARTQEIPVPPIELQREFARRVSAVEKLKAAQRASLAELDALFASLQYRAFRGEL